MDIPVLKSGRIPALTITGNLSVGGTLFTNVTANVLQKYSGIIGDAVNTSYTVVHNLFTTDVITQVFDVASNSVAYPSVQVLNLSSVSIGFTNVPALSSYKVLVFGSASSNQIPAYGPMTHAPSHALNGSDPISAYSIGADKRGASVIMSLIFGG